MSFKEIIRKNMNITNKKWSKITTKVTHCQNCYYQYQLDMLSCEKRKCNSKLFFNKMVQISNERYHFYFTCCQKHFIIRNVSISNRNIIIENLKN